MREETPPPAHHYPTTSLLHHSTNPPILSGPMIAAFQHFITPTLRIGFVIRHFPTVHTRLAIGWCATPPRLHGLMLQPFNVLTLPRASRFARGTGAGFAPWVTKKAETARREDKETARRPGCNGLLSFSPLKEISLTLRASLPCPLAAWRRAEGKSESRNSKTERRPKPEARMSHSSSFQTSSCRSLPFRGGPPNDPALLHYSTTPSPA